MNITRKTNQWHSGLKLGIVALLALAILSAACQPTPAPTQLPEQLPEEPTAPPPAEPTATQEAEAPQPPDDIQPVPIEEVQNIEWQWSGFIETQPAAQSVVPDPQNYTLVLGTDGVFNAKADCNLASGSYTAYGSNLALQLGPVTLAECGPDSLYNQYLALLGSVVSFGMRDGNLALTLADDAGRMEFINGGALEPAPAPSATPIACNAGIDPATVTIETMELPHTYQPNCVLATPYDNSQPPGPVGLPDHIQVNFDVTDPQDVEPLDPIIYIIPVAQYTQLWDQAGDGNVSQNIEMLEGVLDARLDPVPTSGLPVLPSERVTGIPDLQVQGKYLDITMGSGVRFVTRFAQDINPVTSDNPQLFYTFQGFSSDGLYLITFFYPVTTDALPKAEDVSDEEQAQVNADFEGYLEAKMVEINAILPSDWEPDLNTLDALIRSLRWGTPPESAPAITGIKWLWAELVETDPASQSVVPDPSSYALVFRLDGSLSLQADCNNGVGSYTSDGYSISIQLGALTQTECGPESLSNQYIGLLGGVETYTMESGRLVLGLTGGGRMIFNNGGSAVDASPGATPEQPIEPTAEAPLAVIDAPTEGQVTQELVFDGSASQSSVDIASYTWDFGDGTIAEGAKLGHAYEAPGEYTVTLTVVDANDQVGTATITVTIT